MSLKIYEAYRCPTSKAWSLFPLIRERGLSQATASLQQLVIDIEQGDVSVLHDGGFPSKKGDIRAWLLQQYKSQVTSSQISWCDFDVFLTVRQKGRFTYLIPHCDGPFVRKCLDFLPYLPDLQEFGYWNSTEKPPEISGHQWSSRKRVWNDLLSPSNRDNVLRLDIVSHQNFWEILFR